MSFFEKIVFIARRINDDGVIRRHQFADFMVNPAAVGGNQRIIFLRLKLVMNGNRQSQFVFFAEVLAVFDISGEGSLSSVHINRGNGKTFLKQFYGQMHGNRRFSGSAFFVADNDYMCFF